MITEIYNLEFWKVLLDEYNKCYKGRPKTPVGLCPVVENMYNKRIITSNCLLSFKRSLSREFLDQQIFYHGDGTKTNIMIFIWKPHLKMPRKNYIRSKIKKYKNNGKG